MKLFIKDKNFERSRFSVIKKFIKELFDDEFPSTYCEKGSTQCYKGRNRSFEDIFVIVKTIFPSVTKDKLAYIIVNEFYRNEDMEMLVCNDIGKLVFTLNRYNCFPVMTFSGENLKNFLNGKFHKNSDIYIKANLTFKRVGNQDSMSMEKLVSMSDSYQNKLNNKKLKNEKRI